MAEERGKELTGHHNDGQKDSVSNDYKEPHSITIVDQIIRSDNSLKEMREDNEAYRAGWENERKNR
jgi:hypothetical protein